MLQVEKHHVGKPGLGPLELSGFFSGDVSPPLCDRERVHSVEVLIEVVYAPMHH